VAELLLVDDEPGIREGLAAVLRMRGHRVRCASSAGDALAVRNERGIELLLTDFKLPDGDGLTLVREFRGVRPELPVLLMTGHASAAVRDALARMPGSRLVEKPIRPAEVARLVEELLAPRVTRDDARNQLAGLPAEERVHVAARLAGACQDTCDRLSLAAFAATLCGGEPNITLSDEGDQVRVEARWPVAARPDLDAARWILDLVGGDVQLDRDGLRVGFPRAGGATEAVDLSTFRPRTRDELTARLRGQGPFRNATPWLRLLFELSEDRPLHAGRTRESELPADLAALWR